MVSSHSNNSTHSEAAKMEQIITEFYAKSLHIILEARTPYMSSRNFSGEHILSSPSSSSSSSSSSVRPRDKWFNLALRECPAALENLDLWRQTNLEPMVVDVLVVQRPLGWDNVNFSPRRELVRTFSSKSDQEEFGSESRNEMVIERWVLQYESKKKPNASLSSGTRRSNNLSTLYKKSILMLRTLYSTVRLLPAYKIFRDLNSSGQICPFTLTHKVSSFVEPFTRKEESEMQRFLFTPVETSGGRLSLSVVYRSLVSDLRSQQSTPISPRFIQDYVGSPLAEPLKRLPSLPLSHGSPSSLQFSRRHSWSFDPYKASPPFPPSPAFSEPRRYPLPRHPQENSYKQNTSFEEYSPSPMFSPSPPIHIPASCLSKTHSRSESAPIRIPITTLADSPVSNKHNLPPSPPLKITRAGTFMNEKSLYRGTTVEKFSFGKDDVRKFSGVRTSSNSSPQISFSRSSSPSFQDDFDDHEFPCPFDVEDDDIIVPGSRPESFDQKGHGCEQQPDSGGLFPVRKSQDAAVGALVRTLKRAQPLCQDFSVTSKPETWENSIQEPNIIPGGSHAGCSSITSSGLVISKTTADAFEELRSYKEMKDLLHSQGGRSYSYSVAAGASTTG